MSHMRTTITANAARVTLNIEGGSFAGGSGSGGAAVTLQLLGTWSGTLQFEASVDGGATFIAVLGFPSTAGSLGTGVSSTTANGVWVFLLGGFTHFSVRASAFASGVAQVEAESNPGDGYLQSYFAAQAQGAISQAFDVATTITRPANATPYTALDTLGGALDLGVLGPSGKGTMITSLQLEADVAAVPAGMTSWQLHMYNVTPPSALADNAPWDLPAGDRASYLGFVSIPTLVDLGSTIYVEITGVNKQILLAGNHIFAYLVTVTGFTPAGNSEVYKLTTHTTAV